MSKPRFSRETALTIRGKIILAFVAIAMITGALGVHVIRSLSESGRLVGRIYDGPLLAIHHARLAAADFAALEAAEADPAANTARIQALIRSVAANIAITRDKAVSPLSAAAAQYAGDAFAASSLGLSAGDRDPARHTVRRDLETLSDLIAEDGVRDRETAMASIDRYQSLSLYATVEVMLIGCLIALALGRELVTPIAAASEAAGRIAAGQLDTEIRSGGQDEMGRLLGSMREMRDNIRTMMEREIAARRSAQTRLVDAIEGGQSGVALIGPDQRVVIANSRLREFFPGNGDGDPDSSGDGIVVGRTLPGAMAAALTDPGGETRLADGRWLGLTHSAAKDGGMVVIATDITALKDREAALRAARDEAEAANRAKTDFLTTMSHELRTPLSAVIGFSEMIAGETFGPLGEPRYREFADDILHAGRHLRDIIADILDIAKAQSGTLVLRPRTIRPDTIIGGVVRELREKARDANVELKLAIEAGLPLIEADTDRLRQVMVNLLSNAIKFTPAGGRIDVGMGSHPDGIAIEVRDNGVGMAPEDIPRALQPFMQLETGFARRYGGIGLGLPLTRIFVELHGGRLEIASALKLGTTMMVILPASKTGARRMVLPSA